MGLFAWRNSITYFLFVRKECARERRELNQEVKHYVHLYDSWNETVYRGPIKSQTSKSLLNNEIRTHFYAYYQTMTGRTKKIYLGRKLAKVTNILNGQKTFAIGFLYNIASRATQSNSV